MHLELHLEGELGSLIFSQDAASKTRLTSLALLVTHCYSAAAAA